MKPAPAWIPLVVALTGCAGMQVQQGTTSAIPAGRCPRRPDDTRTGATTMQIRRMR